MSPVRRTLHQRSAGSLPEICLTNVEGLSSGQNVPAYRRTCYVYCRNRAVGRLLTPFKTCKVRQGSFRKATFNCVVRMAASPSSLLGEGRQKPQA